MTKKRTKADKRTAPAVDVPAASAVPAAEHPPGRLDLGTSCTLPDVTALRAACLAVLEGVEPPVIDGSRVERVDTAGLQVLVGFTIDCMERSLNFSWVGRSPELARGIRLLGVEPLLESPGVATSPMGGVA